jgi:hypothetical protein
VFEQEQGEVETWAGRDRRRCRRRHSGGKWGQEAKLNISGV